MSTTNAALSSELRDVHHGFGGNGFAELLMARLRLRVDHKFFTVCSAVSTDVAMNAEAVFVAILLKLVERIRDDATPSLNGSRVYGCGCKSFGQLVTFVGVGIFLKSPGRDTQTTDMAAGKRIAARRRI